MVSPRKARERRRSRRIAVLAAGGACLLVYQLWNEETPPPLPDSVTVYPDAEICAKATGDRAACQISQSQAVSEHFQAARRYDDRATCEKEFGEGNCDPTMDNDGVRFVPAFAGFALASALGTANAVPVHYDRNGYARVVGGYTLGKRKDDDQQQASSGGGGGGGFSWGSRKPTTIATADSNMRGSGVIRSGFGRAFGGGG